jgi:riboflavin biosynthesis pyrimidine reductase/DNA-binding MarR family transcriptional regulator
MLTAAAADLDDDELARLYDYPRDFWLRANMVASADGAAYLDGRSGGLSSAADRRLFAVLRALADVVLVGAGTARAEKYKPARRRPELAPLRAGRSHTPPIALVSRALDLDLSAPLFAQAPPDARTIVITCDAAPGQARAAAAKVADVIVAGELAVDLDGALAALNDRSLGRVLCEGGPTLLGQLAAAGLVNELCLTVSPLLAGPGPSRITVGAPFSAQQMALVHVLRADETLFCRYMVLRRGVPRRPEGVTPAELLRHALSVITEHMQRAGSVLDVTDVAAGLRVAVGVLTRKLKQMQLPGELTVAETSALSRLDRGGPASSSELAKQDRISPQSMGATLAALEQRSLVARDRDPGDGRRIVLSITDAGRQLVNDRRGARTEQIATALRGAFTDAELGQLLAVVPLLERLAEKL